MPGSSLSLDLRRHKPLRALAGGFLAALAMLASCSAGDPFRGTPGEATGGSSGSTSSEAGAGGVPAPGDGGRPSTDAGAPGAPGGESSGAGGDGAAQGGSGGEGPVTCGTGTADCNDDPADGCEASLTSPKTCGNCETACGSVAPLCTRVGSQRICTVKTSVTSERLELPCVADAFYAELCKNVEGTCPEGGRVITKSFTLDGSPDALYDISMRVRGVLEPRVYTGGTKSGDHFYVGGAPVSPSNYNAVSITVSSPAQTYYLNLAEGEGEAYRVLNLNYTAAVRAKGGSTVTLKLEDADCSLVRNCRSFDGACEPYVPAGVPPAPESFNGQFVQLDLVSVTPAL